MKIHIRGWRWAVVAAMLASLHAGTSLALNEQTHELINEQAAETSQLDSVLKEQLGLPDGTATRFKENRVLQWIRLGGRLEDEGTLWEMLRGKARFFRHFHDPLQPWDQAGLKFLFFPRFQSSIRWAQRTDQSRETGHGNYSWLDARRYYQTALTGESPTLREQAFADTFRALGQTMHLVVDASVPEHVRNDEHPLGPVFGNYEYWVSAQHPDRDSEQAFVQGFLSAPIALDPELLKIPITASETIARVPIARLFDSDRYTGANPEVTADPRIGIAEVANANFFSEDTRHGDYPHPARANLERYVRLYTKTGRPRAYFRKRGAGLTVDPVAEECVLNEPAGLDELCVDTDVWRETARHMLPRAVSYSTALLDYFFRGKLELDLVEDETDPARVRLIGTNGSREPFVEGTLSLYADPPSGVRSPVAEVSALPVSGIAPGQDLFPQPVPFQAPPDAERFVAVYQGTLGQERADGGSPGAVIGKVLGGVRVEEVFSDGARWYLRTPQGVYPLPIAAQEVAELRWGDRDNTLVGRSYFGPGQPNQFFAYEIARPAGSSAVPLATQPDGSQAVEVRLLKQVGFPFGLDLGTTIQFTEMLQYQQYLLSYVTTTTSIFDHCEGAGGACFYRFQDFTVSDGQAPLMVNETRAITRSYPVSLDPGKLANWTPPYMWDLREIGLTPEGQILAVVVVWLTSPEETATFPAFTLTVDFTAGNSGTLVPQPVPADPVTVPLSFPLGTSPALWALVDVGAGRVVASTAPGTLTITHTTPHTNLSPRPGVVAALEFRKLRLLGGPAEGYRYDISGPFPTERFPAACPQADLVGLQPLAEVSLQSGTLEAALTQYRPELAALQFPSPIEDLQQTVDQYLFLCRSTHGVSAGFTVTTNIQGFRPSRLDQVLRSGPGGGAEQLALLLVQAQPGGGGPPEIFAAFDGAPAANAGGGDQSKLVAWHPGQERAELRQLFPQPGIHFVSAGSPRSALVISELTDGSGATTLVPLEGPGASVVFPDLQLTGFLLLAPDFLYNPEAMRFYTKRPPLQRTPLPAPLAAVPGNPVGAYHTVPAP